MKKLVKLVFSVVSENEMEGLGFRRMVDIAKTYENLRNLQKTGQTVFSLKNLLKPSKNLSKP